jgi:hypothetical protein
MRTLIRAVTLVVLLVGVAGVAAAQRGRVDIELGRRPWVRGHVVIGPRFHYRSYYHRPYAVRPYAYRHHYRRPVVIAPRLHSYRRPYIRQRSHYRYF